MANTGFERSETKSDSREFDTPLSTHKILRETAKSKMDEKISSLYGTSCRVQPGPDELPLLQIGTFSTGCEYQKFEEKSPESRNYVQAKASAAHFYSKDGEWTSRFPIGTGFAVKKSDDRCYLLTDNHVVDGVDQIQVKLSDGQLRSAELQNVDESRDLALLSVDTGDDTASICQPVDLVENDFAASGDKVHAIGYPARSESLYLSPAEHKGVIPRSDFRDADGDELGLLKGEDPTRPVIVLDAHVEGGNSGSPVFNEKGRVGGIVDAGDSTKYRAAFASSINRELVNRMIESSTKN